MIMADAARVRAKWIAACCALVAQTAFADDTPHEAATAMEKVIVTSGRETPPTERTELTDKLLKIPGSFADPLQAVYNLPGVVQSAEAGGAPAVRGSAPGENLFLVDFLPAGYIFHDFGFSIFDENLLRDFGLKSAGFGARYGGVIGAVFDVSLRDPRPQPWTYTVDTSFLRIAGLAEGQLSNNQSMYVSARESLIHLLLRFYEDKIKDEQDISFPTYPRARDLQAKYTWNIDEYNRISILGLGAQDQTTVRLGSESDIALVDPGLAGDAKSDTAFGRISADWLYDDGINRLRTAVGYMDESRDLSSGNGAEFNNIDATRTLGKTQYDRKLGAHVLGLGVEYDRANFEYDTKLRYRSCTAFTPECTVDRGPVVALSASTNITSIDGFVEDQWRIAQPFVLTPGVHVTHNDYLDETYIEPRVAGEWQLNAEWQLHGSWGKYHQLPTIGQIIPVFGNPDLISRSATHYVLGVGNQSNDGWSWNSDVYYKEMDNLIVDVTTGQQYVNGATGTAYGLELLVSKNRDDRIFAGRANRARWVNWLDRFYGWVSLSLSKSKRHDEVNDTTAVFAYDTPAIANLVLNYRIARSWDAGLRWNFRSGLPYTPIVSNKPNPDFTGFYLPVFGDLNSARARPYHRLDVRGEYQWSSRKLQGSVYLEIINVYNRQNGGAVQYKPVAGTSDYRLEEDPSLPRLPSIGVKLVF